MSEYEPGTVAVATVRGIEGVRAFRSSAGGWFTAEYVGEWRMHNDSDVTDVRPLVVLDLDTIATPEDNCGIPASAEVVKCLNRAGESAGGWRGTVAMRIADQIDQQTKPLRIPEPGLWGVVEAETNFSTRRWVHHEEGRWINMGTILHWEDLRNPVLVREGISE